MNVATIPEPATVALLRSAEAPLRRGSVGTVVHAYPATSERPAAYDVEFVDNGGRTYALARFAADELLVLNFREVAA